MRVNVMAITEKSGSGKTTSAHKLQGALKDSKIVSLNSFYHDLSHLPYNNRAKINFDVPSSLD
jgi:uridine kinase